MKLSSLLFFLLLTVNLIAQSPGNDDCFMNASIPLGIAPACPDSLNWSNLDATASVISSNPAENIPTCWNAVNNDVWFTFETPSGGSIVDFTLYIDGIDNGNGTPLSDPQVAIYRGEDCLVDEIFELLCAQAAPGETSVELDLEGLTPGTTYYMRVDGAFSNQGDFTVCVDTLQQDVLISEGSSTACSGNIFDSGGAEGPYTSNENHVFTICPEDFHNCINMTIDWYNLEFFTDNLTIYDGPDTSSPLIGSLTGGGVCHPVQASSGCITLQFFSDGSTNFEGFAGSWICTLAECEPSPSITVDASITEDDIIEAVSTPQTTVDMIQVNCGDGQYGTFEAFDNTELGLEKGIVLTSGSINNALGPNDANGLGIEVEPLFFEDPSDTDLNFLSSLSGGYASDAFDVCIVELDVFAATNELTFEYVFGSEEYTEWVGSNFNDIFAFLISGPGIVGYPEIGNQDNIAIIPGTDTPVEINSVNQNLNWEYYRNNPPGNPYYGGPAPLNTIQYDGLTSDYLGVKKSLTARAQVEPCNTYHLKLAIADRGDESLDSGVFISEIKSGVPNLIADFTSGLDYLIENCTEEQDQILVTLNNPLEDTVSYQIQISGTAEFGIDYTLEVPDVAVIPPGQTMLSFPIIPLTDELDEGEETIEIALTNDFGCGNITYTTLIVNITDDPTVDINAGADTVYICQGSSVELMAEGAQNYFWTPVSVVEDPTSATTLAETSVDQWVFLEGSVGLCIAYDSVFLKIIDPAISIQTAEPISICQGSSVTLEAINNTNGSNIMWTPAFDLPDPSSPIITVTPPQTTTYTATIQLLDCIVQDQITVTVDQFDFPEITTEDTTLCQGQPLMLASMITNTTTTYTWTPATYLDDPSASGPLAIPQEDISYTLFASSPNSLCLDTATVNVAVIPIVLDILQNDDQGICIGDSIALNASSSTGEITWSPDNNSLSSLDELNVIATPAEDIYYFASMTFGPCTVTDSVFVQVDSLPNALLEAIPDQATYCIGDAISFISPTYEPLDFPELIINWQSGPGFQTELSNWNAVIVAVEDYEYERISTNGLCADTSILAIDVVELAIDILQENTTICTGENIALTVETSTGDVTWTPDDGSLSALDELEVIATPGQSTVYTASITVDDCTLTDNVTIDVADVAVDILQENTNICLGESITLTANANVGEITWTPDDGSLNTTTGVEVIATPLTNTTYTVNATLGNCSAENVITIEVNDVSLNIVQENTTICAGENITLTATSSTGEVSWSPDDGSLSALNGLEVVATPTEATTYIASTGLNGCDVENSVEISLTSVDILQSNTTICLGESITLNAISDTDEIVWTPDASLNTGTGAEVIATPESTTVYYANIMVDDCTAQDSIVVEVIDIMLDLAQDDTTICPGDSLLLTATTNIGEIVWTAENGDTIGTGNELIVTPQTTTVYLGTVTIGQCSDDVGVEIVVTELPDGTITANPDLNYYCYGDTPITLSSSFNPATYPGLGIEWQDGPGFISNTDERDMSLSAVGIGSYTYERVLTLDGCTVSDFYTITTLDTLIDLGITEASICPGEVVAVFNEVYWTWAPTSGLTFNDDFSLVTIAPDSTTTYMVSDSCGNTAELMVTVNKVSIDPDPTGDQLEGTSVILTAEPNIPGATYGWTQNGNIISDTTPSTEVTIVEGENIFTVTSPDGCPAIISIMGEPFRYALPTVFMPNSKDTLNQTFRLICNNKINEREFTCAENLQLNFFKVFNRWGQVVYDGTNINQGWDGTYNDTAAPADVYHFIMEVTDLFEDNPELKTITLKGEVTLIR